LLSDTGDSIVCIILLYYFINLRRTLRQHIPCRQIVFY